MEPSILYALISLGGIAVFAAMLLFIIAKQFRVEEDPRIDVVAEMLPGANCGACGAPGCRGFAEILVDAAASGDLSGKVCPASSSETMVQIGEILGVSVAVSDPSVAVVCCGGKKEMGDKPLLYDGPHSCVIAHTLFSGEKGCAYGCLGEGDCVLSCKFDALSIDETSGLPVVDADNCVACGACVKACPRNIIELRPVGKKEKRVWVNCRNRDKGAQAKKVCDVACIGCGKCVKACPEKIQAVTLENNLAYIDPDKCITCGKCIKECPTGAITASFELKKRQVSGEILATAKIEEDEKIKKPAVPKKEKKHSPDGENNGTENI